MFEWSEDVTSRAVTMWRDKHAARDIAEHIGTTRNSVIGKMHRLGELRGVWPDRTIIDPTPAPEPVKVEPKAVEPEPEPAPAPEPQPEPQPIPVKLDKMFDQVPPTEPPLVKGVDPLRPNVAAPRPMQNLEDVEGDQSVAFLDAPSTGRCKFPLWADISSLPITEKRFCGRSSPGGVWCKHHFPIVSDQSIRRKR